MKIIKHTNLYDNAALSFSSLPVLVFPIIIEECEKFLGTVSIWIDEENDVGVGIELLSLLSSLELVLLSIPLKFLEVGEYDGWLEEGEDGEIKLLWRGGGWELMKNDLWSEVELTMVCLLGLFASVGCCGDWKMACFSF